METIRPCACGCGEPAVYAVRHIRANERLRLTKEDCVIEDTGYETPCWLFKKDRAGRYTIIRIRGKSIMAHRAMYEQEIGPIPKPLVIDHLCAQTKCIRPDHLEAVTSRVNLRRGRLPKLTEQQAEEIRQLRGTAPAASVAQSFGVSKSLIFMIWAGKIWKTN